MSDVRDEPLVAIMAKAGYDTMVRLDNERERRDLHDALDPWEKQTHELRADWITTARAMLDAWHNHIKGKPLP